MALRLQMRGVGVAALVLILSAPAGGLAGPDDRAAIRTLDRRVGAQERRLGSGPDAARRLRLGREAERLGTRLDGRLAQPGSSVGSSRSNLRALERRIDEIDARRRSRQDRAIGADDRGGRILDIRIPETDLSPSDLEAEGLEAAPGLGSGTAINDGSTSEQVSPAPPANTVGAP